MFLEGGENLEIEKTVEFQSVENNSIKEIKDHKEILKLINEIEKYENQFKKYDIPEIEFNEIEITDLSEDSDTKRFIPPNFKKIFKKQEKVEFFQIDDKDTKFQGELTIESWKTKLQPILKYLPFSKQKPIVEYFEVENNEKKFKSYVKKEPKYNTFTFRFNEEGKLTISDKRKMRSIKKFDDTSDSKKRFNLKIITSKIKRKKGETSTEEDNREKGSKLSGLKSKFGKIGGIKKVIPHKRKTKDSKDAEST